MFALLGVLAHRLVTLARQGKQWTQRRVRLTGIHAVLILLQVSAVRTRVVASGTLLYILLHILDRLRRADDCCHGLTAARLVVQVPSNILYLAVNAWTLAGYCRLNGALIDWFKCVPTISVSMHSCKMIKSLSRVPTAALLHGVHWDLPVQCFSSWHGVPGLTQVRPFSSLQPWYLFTSPCYLFSCLQHHVQLNTCRSVLAFWLQVRLPASPSRWTGHGGYTGPCFCFGFRSRCAHAPLAPMCRNLLQENKQGLL